MWIGMNGNGQPHQKYSVPAAPLSGLSKARRGFELSLPLHETFYQVFDKVLLLFHPVTPGLSFGVRDLHAEVGQKGFKNFTQNFSLLLGQFQFNHDKHLLQLFLFHCREKQGISATASRIEESSSALAGIAGMAGAGGTIKIVY
jgi:hypothetical protein